MTRLRLSLVAIIVAGVLVPAGVCAQPDAHAAPPAQEPGSHVLGPMTPGMLIVVTRVAIKPGREAAVQKIEASLARLAFTKAASMPYSLAMLSMAGPSEAVFMTPLPSWAAADRVVELGRQMPDAVSSQFDDLASQEAQYLDGARSLVCEYLPELSNLASTDVSAYRYMEVTTYRVRASRLADFRRVAAVYVAAAKKVLPDSPWAMVEVSHGAPVGTFMVFHPHKKMAELEPDPALEKARAEALGPEGQQKMKEALTDIVMSIDVTLFGFSSSMSSVAPLYAKSDRWWTWKAARPAARPGAAKKEKGEEPAKK